MRGIVIFLTILTLGITGVIPLESQVYGQSSGKVLMILREGKSVDLDLMIEKEVGVMTALLKKAGFEVDIATTSGRPVIGSTQKIENISKLSEVKLEKYVGAILACMAVGMLPGPPVSPEQVVAVKKVVADGKPVAASANSSSILAEAGILKGKKYALGTDPLNPGPLWQGTPDFRYKDAVYSGTGVVQDGKIITSAVCPVIHSTSGMADGTTELTQKFIAAIGPK